MNQSTDTAVSWSNRHTRTRDSPPAVRDLNPRPRENKPSGTHDTVTFVHIISQLITDRQSSPSY